MWKVKPVVGDKVWACYDGKYRRRVSATVIGVRGFMIRVRFKPEVDGKPVEAWFPFIKKHQCYGAVVKEKGSLMDLLLGIGGDWYAIYPKG